MTISGPAGGGALLDSSGGLLAEVVASKMREAVEQVHQVGLALAFCAFNSPDSRHPAAVLPGSEGELSLAGPGAPTVAEFAVVEFGAVAGMSTDAARRYLGRCLELGHRLPRVWAATRAGQVPAWRALRVAEHTLALPVEGAAWVDAQVAPVAGRVGPAVLQRLVTEAIVRFDPEAAALAEITAAESRHATITLDHALSELGQTGLPIGRLEAILDAVDALDLDTALADLAADLADAGDTAPLDVRRARALGLLARGEAVDPPDPADPADQPDQPDPPDQAEDAGSTASRPHPRPHPHPRPRRRRELVLHVHLTEAEMHGAGDGFATLCSHTGHPYGQVTIEQVQDWCTSPGAQVTVKPVLDLAETIHSTGYQPSARLRDQVTALNPTCVFPHCHRPSANLDLDHIQPYQPDQPEAATTSENLAPLCRRHHRAKTHGGWTYTRLGPAEHLWTSPHGHQWVTDPDGTRPLATSGLSTGPP